MKKRINSFFIWVKNNPLAALIILVAAILHFVVIVPSGSHYCFQNHCGDYYWGVQEHDGIWHVAVAETAFNGVFGSTTNPSFAGTSLAGYNILLDYILHLGSLSGISVFIIYFKILPIIWFILFTYTLVVFAQKVSKQRFFLTPFLILSYFGTSWSFLFTLLLGHTINDGQASPIMQPILTLTNLQLAFSYIVLLWSIIILGDTSRMKSLFLIPFFIFLAWGLKFYAGMLLSVIVGITLIIRILRKKDKTSFFTLALSVCASVISIFFIYHPTFGKNSQPTFIMQPLALVWPLVESPGSIYHSEYWANAKYVLMNAHSISPRLIVFSIFISIAYVCINLGTRLLGFIEILVKKRDDIDYGIIAALVVGIAMPLCVIQRGVWWNVVQYFYIVFFLLHSYTAAFIAQIRKPLVLKVVVSLLIISAIPYTYSNLMPYITRGRVYVSDTELEALRFLKKQERGVVYVPLYNIQKRLFLGNVDILDIRTSNDTSYISAYTGKQTYLQVTGSILLANDYKKREQGIQQADCSLTRQFQYVYFNLEDRDKLIQKCVESNATFKKIYSKKGYIIYSKNTKDINF